MLFLSFKFAMIYIIQKMLILLNPNKTGIFDGSFFWGESI